MFIIDDCSAEGEINKKRDALSDLAFSGRHRNHSLHENTILYPKRTDRMAFAYSLQKSEIVLKIV